MVLPVFWAPPAQAADSEVRLERPANLILDVVGKDWRLRYPSRALETRHGELLAQLVPAGPGRAYFLHGVWIRLIDTNAGVVIGRWRLPSPALSFKPEGESVRIEIDASGGYGFRERHAFVFRPEAPNFPHWPPETLMYLSLPEREATEPNLEPLTTQQQVQQREEMLRRDPLSPWLAVYLARLLKQADGARARALLEQALAVPSTDYTELLPIAAFLEREGDHEMGGRFFDRGYRNFWQHGMDPRLHTVLISRLVLYHPFRPNRTQIVETPARADTMERVYRLAPYAEAAPLAWRLHADALRARGDGAATLWAKRAADAEAHSAYVAFPSLTLAADRGQLLVVALVLAAIAYLRLLDFKYWPQRRLDSAANRGRWNLFGIGYWSRAERLAFLSIVVAAWLASGITGIYMRGMLRSFELAVSMGTGALSAPASVRYLSTPSSAIEPAPKERELMLAIAYQQAGDSARAEKMYRALPGFAQSWNNLGVLLAERGEASAAREAFEQALRLDPQLPEAALNLGRDPGNEWTTLHKQMLPGRPMLAPPSREQFRRELLGTRIIPRVLLGPVVSPVPRMAWFFSADRFVIFWDTVTKFCGYFLFALLAAAITAVFLAPMRDVTQPPSRWQFVREVFFPGTAPQYGIAGGLLLAGWFYLLVQMLLTVFYMTPFIRTEYWQPNLNRAYGVPNPGAGILFRPHWFWLYAAPALLSAINALVVWHAKRRESAAAV